MWVILPHLEAWSDCRIRQYAQTGNRWVPNHSLVQFFFFLNFLKKWTKITIFSPFFWAVLALLLGLESFVHYTLCKYTIQSEKNCVVSEKESYMYLKNRFLLIGVLFGLWSAASPIRNLTVWVQSTLDQCRDSCSHILKSAGGPQIVTRAVWIFLYFCHRKWTKITILFSLFLVGPHLLYSCHKKWILIHTICNAKSRWQANLFNLQFLFF